jgi:hypothetical protein
MDLSHLVISTWAEVAVTPETGPSMLDLDTQMHLRSDNPLLVEVVSMAEVEEEVEEILAFDADPQTIATRSDLEIDHHRLQGGEAYLVATGMTGVQRDAKMIAGLIAMTVSVSPIVSDGTL